MPSHFPIHCPFVCTESCKHGEMSPQYSSTWTFHRAFCKSFCAYPWQYAALHCCANEISCDQVVKNDIVFVKIFLNTNVVLFYGSRQLNYLAKVLLFLHHYVFFREVRSSIYSLQVALAGQEIQVFPLISWQSQSLEEIYCL